MAIRCYERRIWGNSVPRRRRVRAWRLSVRICPREWYNQSEIGPRTVAPMVHELSRQSRSCGVLSLSDRSHDGDTERDRAALPAAATLGQDQPCEKDSAAQVGLHRGHYEGGEHRQLGNRLQLADERLLVRLKRGVVEDRLLGRCRA
jgi:hypothetical protein